MNTRLISAGMVYLAVTGFILFATAPSQLPVANASQDDDPKPAAGEDETKPKTDEQDEPGKSLLAPFMRRKLEASNKILEGLVTDNTSMIVDGADILGRMSNEEKWRASNDMMYLNHSRRFREAVDILKEKAKKGSLDGAALAWMDVTMSCISCHEWVRNVLIADATAIPLKSHLQGAEQVSLAVDPRFRPDTGNAE